MENVIESVQLLDGTRAATEALLETIDAVRKLLRMSTSSADALAAVVDIVAFAQATTTTRESTPRPESIDILSGFRLWPPTCDQVNLIRNGLVRDESSGLYMWRNPRHQED